MRIILISLSLSILSCQNDQVSKYKTEKAQQEKLLKARMDSIESATDKLRKEIDSLKAVRLPAAK